MNPSDDQSWGGTGRGRAVAIATGMSWSLHHRMRSYAFSFPHVMVSSMSKAHRPLGMGLRIVVHMNAKLWADHTNHLSYPPFFKACAYGKGKRRSFRAECPSHISPCVLGARLRALGVSFSARRVVRVHVQELRSDGVLTHCAYSVKHVSTPTRTENMRFLYSKKDYMFCSSFRIAMRHRPMQLSP